MPIESVMYFALGALAASLVALLIIPAIWGRAVRLTKKRIEAATPVSLSEFRADKDQLRAEFALSTRRLEMNIEALRNKLAEQVAETARKTFELDQIKAEHDKQASALRDGDSREGDLRRRVLELESETAELTQRLRLRDQDYASKAAELEAAREGAVPPLPNRTDLEGKPLSGDYLHDVDQLLASLAAERNRSSSLEHQARSPVNGPQASNGRSSESAAAAAELRQAQARKIDGRIGDSDDLAAAEAKLASAESRLTALLEETQQLAGSDGGASQPSLAGKLTLEDRETALRNSLRSVEREITRDWDKGQLSETRLRERLNEIASGVNQLALNGEEAPAADAGESLFERVQRYAENGIRTEEAPSPKLKIVPKPRRSNNGTNRPNRGRDVPNRS